MFCLFFLLTLAEAVINIMRLKAREKDLNCLIE